MNLRSAGSGAEEGGALAWEEIGVWGSHNPTKINIKARVMFFMKCKKLCMAMVVAPTRSYTVKRPQKHFDPTSFEVISYLVERGFASVMIGILGPNDTTKIRLEKKTSLKYI